MTVRLRRWPTPRILAAGLALVLAAPLAHADFAVAISPPRFELQARPGEVVRQTMEITNASALPGKYRVRTADWTYAPNGTVDFIDELAPGSCRPWVALERRDLTVGPGRPYRFRFEVTPPAGAPVGECRFAILVEGEEESTSTGSLTVPFNARMAVIVYLGVGDAQPRLSIAGHTVQIVNGRPTPALLVRNDGPAHGRLGGFLQGSDATIARLEFTPSSAPILPGETRAIPLLASRPGDPDGQLTLRFPVVVKGRLEWGRNQSQDIDLQFGP
jgi:hypothetical protein